METYELSVLKAVLSVQIHNMTEGLEAVCQRMQAATVDTQEAMRKFIDACGKFRCQGQHQLRKKRRS